MRAPNRKQGNEGSLSGRPRPGALITIKEAAEMLAVAPKTIYSWAYSRNGRLEFVKLGRCVRVVKDSVYALIDRSRLS